MDVHDEPVVTDSARRHGVTDEDIIHAYDHPIRVFDLDDITMVVGGDRHGRLLEVGVVTNDDVSHTIVHAMPARSKFVR